MPLKERLKSTVLGEDSAMPPEQSFYNVGSTTERALEEYGTWRRFRSVCSASEGANDRMTWVKLTYQRRRVRICVQPVSGEPETLINTRRKKLYTLGYQE